MTFFRPRYFALASVSVLEVLADRQPYRFEAERVPNAEDRESENDRLQGTFSSTHKRRETMAAQRECVCCREQPESENKMEATIQAYTALVAVNGKTIFFVNCFRY